MTKTSKGLIGFYLVLCIIEIFNIHSFPENRIYTKPTLMPALLLVALSLNNFKLSKISLLLVSILFAWLGDIFLLTNHSMSFVAGLCSFLIMHLIYLYLFNKQRSIGVHKHLKAIFFISAFIIACILLFWDRTGELQIPVATYCVVIGLMSLYALMRWKSKHYWYVVIGSILFMVSDLCIALNKFYLPFDNVDFLVMLTYMSAQLLIVYGYIKDLK